MFRYYWIIMKFTLPYVVKMKDEGKRIDYALVANLARQYTEFPLEELPGYNELATFKKGLIREIRIEAEKHEKEEELLEMRAGTYGINPEFLRMIETMQEEISELKNKICLLENKEDYGR